MEEASFYTFIVGKHYFLEDDNDGSSQQILVTKRTKTKLWYRFTGSREQRHFNPIKGEVTYATYTARIRLRYGTLEYIKTNGMTCEA